MSDELKVTVQTVLANGFFKDQFNPGQVAITQNAIGGHRPIVVVGTSEEDVAVGDVGTLGYCVLRSLEPAGGNYVQWGPKSAGSMVAVGRLKPGEVAVLRLEPGITLRWVANTAAVKVDVRLYED